jgi:hypothetical protein
MEYPDDNVLVRQRKQAINDELVAILAAEENFDFEGKKALCLDAPSFQTSHALVQLLPASAIIVPNPFETIKMSEALKKFPELDGLTLVKKYSGQMLARDLDARTLGFAYLDWTCTFEGSGPIKPKKELQAAFKRSVFCDGCVVAFTVHVPRILGSMNAEQYGENVIATLNEIVAKFEQDEVAVVSTKHYENAQSQMFLAVVRVRVLSKEKGLKKRKIEIDADK